MWLRLFQEKLGDGHVCLLPLCWALLYLLLYCGTHECNSHWLLEVIRGPQVAATKVGVPDTCTSSFHQDRCWWSDFIIGVNQREKVKEVPIGSSGLWEDCSSKCALNQKPAPQAAACKVYSYVPQGKTVFSCYLCTDLRDKCSCDFANFFACYSHKGLMDPSPNDFQS